MTVPPTLIQTGPKTASLSFRPQASTDNKAGSEPEFGYRVLHTVGMAVHAHSRATLPVGRAAALDLLCLFFGGQVLKQTAEPRFPPLPSMTASSRNAQPMAKPLRPQARDDNYARLTIIFVVHGSVFTGCYSGPAQPRSPALPAPSVSRRPKESAKPPKALHYPSPSPAASAASGVSLSGHGAFGHTRISEPVHKEAPTAVEPKELGPTAQTGLPEPVAHPEAAPRETPEPSAEDAQPRQEPVETPAGPTPPGVSSTVGPAVTVDHTAHVQMPEPTHTVHAAGLDYPVQAYAHRLDMTRRLDEYLLAAARHRELARKESQEAERHAEEAQRAAAESQARSDSAQQIRRALENAAQANADQAWTQQQVAQAARLEQQAEQYTLLAMQHDEQGSGRRAAAREHTAQAEAFDQKAADVEDQMQMP